MAEYTKLGNKNGGCMKLMFVKKLGSFPSWSGGLFIKENKIDFKLKRQIADSSDWPERN